MIKTTINQTDQTRALIVFILIVSILILFYSMYVVNDIVSRDQWGFLSLIQDYKSGDFDIISLWETHSQQRTPLYKLWFLLNANAFHLNTYIDIYIGIMSICIMVFVIIRDSGFLKTWLSNRYAFLSLMAIILTSFNLNQWSQLTYGLNAFQDLFGTLCLVGMFFYIRKALYLNFTSTRAIYLFLIIMSFSLFIGEVRTPAAAIAAFGACFILLLETPSKRLRLSKYLVVIFSAFAISQLIYWLVPPSTIHLTKNGVNQGLFDQTLNAISYFLVFMANGIIPATIIKAKLSIVAIQLIGGMAVLMMTSVVYWSIKNKIYKDNPIPLMMIIFSVAYAMELLVARFNLGFGLNNAMAPRYVNEVIVGYIGVVWSAGLLLSKHNIRLQTLQRFNILSVLVVFSLVPLISSVVVINYAKYQRKANENFLVQVKDIANRKDGVSKTLPKWACNHQVACLNGIDFLKQNDLNAFRMPYK